MKKKRVDLSWKYVISSYIVFGIMVLGICGTASMVFHASPIVMRILSNACAWSPTLILFMAFSKWCPSDTILSFLKKSFQGKLKISLILISILSTGAVFVIATILYGSIKGVSLTEVYQIGSYPIILTILLSLLSGPTGEECGWRGYLRREFSGKYGFLKGNIFTGLVWTFWHTILWVVDSDFTSGMEIFIYVASNIVVITSIHMIMACILDVEDNLTYAVLIHFFFNLPYSFLNADISFFAIIMPLYLLEALVFLILRRQRTRRKI